MPKPRASRAQRAQAALTRMPHVPPLVAERIRAAFEVADFPERGVFAAVNDYFHRLAEEGRALEEARPEDFRAVGTSRTRLRVLLWSLETFCPEAPLAAAQEVVKEWDRWLNGRYNVKEKKPRQSTRVAALPEDWPEAWQAALPCIDRAVRIGEVRYRPLAPKTRDAVIQAVGTMATARAWAVGRGVALGAGIDTDLVEVFARFLLSERRISPGSAADYLERARGLAIRGRLLDAAADATFGEIIGALREEADEADPGKREKIRQFRRRFTLVDVMLRAIALAQEAEAWPGHTEAAARRNREAMILALLVNTGDRQGDLSTHRIGIDLTRNPDGLWEPSFKQSKTSRRKENGPLWRLTSDLIDRHILGDRPAWVLGERVADLHCMNLVSLRHEGMGLYYPSQVLRRAFGISGHLVRTLIVDAIRVSRPDAAWAAQFMLGHGTRDMQEQYRTDFRELAAVRTYHSVIEEIMTAAMGD